MFWREFPMTAMGFLTPFSAPKTTTKRELISASNAWWLFLATAQWPIRFSRWEFQHKNDSSLLCLLCVDYGIDHGLPVPEQWRSKEEVDLGSGVARWRVGTETLHWQYSVHLQQLVPSCPEQWNLKWILPGALPQCPDDLSQGLWVVPRRGKFWLMPPLFVWTISANMFSIEKLMCFCPLVKLFSNCI